MSLSFVSGRDSRNGHGAMHSNRNQLTNSFQYWEELVKQRAVPDAEYEQYPRGRVSYGKKSGKFTLLADRCILREQGLIEAILSRMCLQARDTETGTDLMYRCSGCLRRNR